MIRSCAGLVAVAVAIYCALPMSVVAQEGARPDASGEELTRFEVVSVKPTELGPASFLIAFRDGRYTARYVTLKRLIQSAYAVAGGPLMDSQVIGGPDWLGLTRFDVEAIAPKTPNAANGTIPQAVQPALRTLLEERFGLKAHVETRETPLLALVLARADGSLGPKLRRRTIPCIPAAVGVIPRADGRTCGAQTGLGTLTATGITIPILANGLSQVIPEISRLVVDRTGLTGTFDIDVRWGSESATVRADRGPFSTPPLDGNAPTFFTALQEQLGLKLESTRGPVPVVVVESVGAPTPN